MTKVNRGLNEIFHNKEMCMKTLQYLFCDLTDVPVLLFELYIEP